MDPKTTRRSRKPYRVGNRTKPIIMNTNIKYKKIITGVSLALLMQGAVLGQNNTSYNVNSIPINGFSNCAFGPNCLTALTTGQYNIGIGQWALVNNTTGIENIAVGSSVLGYNNGSMNTGTGYGALGYNSSGYENTACGNRALFANTTGYYNTGVGKDAMYSNINGVLNNAFGREALYYNTSGSYNAALSSRALYQNVTGSRNTAAGHLALTNANASDNAAFGNSAMYWNTSGHHNTGIGTSALGGNTTGSYNTSIGYDALDINTTGSNNTALGAQADVSTFNLTNATAVGYQAIVNASNKVRIGDNNVTVVEIAAGAVYTGSDGRFKNNFSENDVKGLEFIKRLRPVVYNYDTKKMTEFLTSRMPDSVRKQYLDHDFSASSSIRRSGFVAQEVEKAANDAGYNFDGVHTPNDANDNYSLAYSQFVVPLVKAVQEQQKMIEEQKQQLEEQKQLINELAKKSGTATGINQPASGATGFSLDQNEPNPFTSETVIGYNIPQQVSSAYMAVYDLSGKQIATFPIEQKGASSMTITSEKLSAGIYIYSIIADNKVMDSKKMIVAGK